MTRSIGADLTSPELAPGLEGGSAGRPELVGQIMDEFHHFIGELRCAGTERLVRAGVSMSHLYVMGLLAQHGDLAMSRIAELLDVSLSNATGIVDRMAEREFVERLRVSDDRRVVLVRLTATGRHVLEEAEIVRRDLIDRLLARLDTSQLARLAATLADVHAAITGLVADDPVGCASIGSSHLTHTHTHSRPETRRPDGAPTPAAATLTGRGS